MRVHLSCVSCGREGNFASILQLPFEEMRRLPVVNFPRENPEDASLPAKRREIPWQVVRMSLTTLECHALVWYAAAAFIY